MMIGSYKSMIKHLNLNLNPRSVPPASYALSLTSPPLNPRYTTDSSWRDLTESRKTSLSIWIQHSRLIYTGRIEHWLLTPTCGVSSMDGHTTCTRTWSSCFNQDWRDWFAVSFSRSLDLRISTPPFFFFILDICWSIGRMLYLLWISDFLVCLLFVVCLAGLLSFFDYFLFSIFDYLYTPTSGYHDQISTNQY